MRLFTDFVEITEKLDAVVTIGTFDGVHRGHLNILQTLVEKATQEKCRSLVITFEPHPRCVISKDFNIKLLSTLEEKKAIIDRAGIDDLFIVNFNLELAGLTAEEFIEKLIGSSINIKHIVFGYDHKFGKDRSGDEKTIREIGKRFNFGVTIVPAVLCDGEEISSTKIRNALLNEGDIEKANKFLGRNYIIDGKVVPGVQRGRLLGFPTANIELNDRHKLIPKKGVYAIGGTVEGKKLFGVMNIGMRPTFADVNDLVIEAHFFDFAKDIYNHQIHIDYIKRLRDEKKFESKEELIAQIEKDKIRALEIIEKLKN